ncbi:MAG: hypothetical protein ACLQVI_22455 [Polyangiaceae bacterium]
MMPLSSRVGGLAREYSGYPDSEPVSAVRERSAPPAPRVEPEIKALLARIVAAVDGKEEGLTAVELRAQLKERPERLQRALAAGLRERRIRRSGSRCQTRYLLND